jgi:septal ring factor EnvC (AmiA/AmiB activator)
LEKRLAAKQAEKDRFVRLYTQEHISEEELEVYLADLKNQTENLRLLVHSVEAELSQVRESREVAENTHGWLVALRERLAEVERKPRRPIGRAAGSWNSSSRGSWLAGKGTKAPRLRSPTASGRRSRAARWTRRRRL